MVLLGRWRIRLLTGLNAAERRRLRTLARRQRDKALYDHPRQQSGLVNVGASYKWSDTISFDVAYSHIFVQDGGFDRTAPVSNLPVSGTIDAAADIVSVGMRSVW